MVRALRFPFERIDPRGKAMARRCARILVAILVLPLVLVASAWALPAYDHDTGWGKASFQGKHGYESYDYDHGQVGDDKKTDKYRKFSSHDTPGRWADLDKHGWGKLEKHKKDYNGHDFVKSGNGHGTYGPDCDPPVSTPEPGTLLVLGSTLAGLGVYARRRRVQPEVDRA